MFTGLELMACQNLAVSAELMRHVVHVESDANPYAIGVVGERLMRQPQDLDEALATVRMLDAGRYDYSLGLAQVNRSNLRKYGLDSYQEAFMPCPNVAAGARILADCYAKSGADWGKAFSCYYSGNFVTGYRDGYVRKIYDSISHGSADQGEKPHATASGAKTVVGQLATGSSLPIRKASEPGIPRSPAYRVAIRSTAFDMATATLWSTGAGAPQPTSQQVSTPMTAPAAGTAASADTRAPVPVTAEPAHSTAMDVFVPRVRGPGDPSPPNASTVSGRTFSTPAAHAQGVDHADLRKEHGDAAFVF